MVKNQSLERVILGDGELSLYKVPSALDGQYGINGHYSINWHDSKKNEHSSLYPVPETLAYWAIEQDLI